MTQEHQLYFDTEHKCVLQIGPDFPPEKLQQTWMPVSESDAEILRAQYAPKLPRTEEIKLEIIAIEATITPRKLRESLLLGDMSYIRECEEKIAALRAEAAALKGAV